MMHYISWFFLPFCLAAIFYYSYTIYASLEFFGQSPASDPHFHPPVTVLKPLCGLDRDTYTNLASFCYQDYPTFQVIFAVREASDPSITVVKQLQADFPDADLQLVISDRLIGNNLKVSNLANALEKAKHPLLVIADSDIRVNKDYLRRIVQPFKREKVGIVTCLYTSWADSLLARFEALGIATQLQPGVLTARQLEGMHFALGSTIAIRQQALKTIGGFFAIANYLADDYQLGYLTSQRGYEVILSECIVSHQLDTPSIASFFRRQTRWARCIRAERFWSYLGLILTQGTVMSMLFWLSTSGSGLGWTVLCLTWGLRLVMAWIVGVKGLNDHSARQWLWLVPVWDVVSFGIWGWGLASDRVEWRGHTFRLLQGGQLIPVEAAQSAKKPEISIAS